MNSRFRYLLVLPPALAFALVLLWGWPGALSVDTLTSIEEGGYFLFGGHQEPMCGLLWAGLRELFEPATAVTTLFVVQTAVYWFAFLLLARSSLQSGSIVTAVLAVVVGFLPPLLCFTVMVESNIQAGVAWLAALAVAASLRARAVPVVVLLLLWLGFVVRSGMIVCLVPVAFACVSLVLPQWSKWRTLGVALGIGLLFQGVSFVVTKTVLGAPTRDSVLSVSQVFDMAGVHQKTGVHHVPACLVPAGRTAEDVFAQYQPNNVSGLFWRGDDKPVFRLPKNPDEGAQVRAAWLQTIREFPGAWIEVKLRYAALFLMLGEIWPGGFWPDYGANAKVGLGKPEEPTKSPLGLYAQVTAPTLLWRGWFWLLLAAVVLSGGLLRRSARTAPAVAVYLGALCSLVPHFLFGQAALSRYYFIPYVLCLVSILLVLPGLLARRPGKRDGPADDGAPGPSPA